MDNSSTKANVLAVGQVPPPYHGQAIMIETMLKGEYDNTEFTFIPMIFSKNINEVGAPTFTKIFKMFRLIFKIIIGRFKYKTPTLYYPPAGNTVVPIFRDIIILLSTRLLFKRTVFHFHASGLMDGYESIPLFLKPFFKLAYNRQSATITLSPSQPPMAKFLKSDEGIILPYGIPDETKGFRRKTVSQVKRILFVGAVREAKGVSSLLEAAKILKEKNIPFAIDIVGEFVAEDYRQYSIKFLQEHGLENYVNFLGLQIDDQKWTLYKKCDIFCFPTFYENEAFPVVLLEALSFGLPIVVTDWRGCPDIVTSENG